MSLIDPHDAVATARLIREGKAVHGYDVGRNIATTRYELRQGDNVLCVNIKTGSEARVLAKADKRAKRRKAKG